MSEPRIESNVTKAPEISTPDSRDRETARKIVRLSGCPTDREKEVENAICFVVSTARREGEAEAAVLREALEKICGIVSDGAGTEMQGPRSLEQAICRQVLHHALMGITKTTAGASLLKRLEDAERKARALDWLEQNAIRSAIFPHKPACIHFSLDSPIVHNHTSKPGYAGTPKSTLLEVIEAAAKEPK